MAQFCLLVGDGRVCVTESGRRYKLGLLRGWLMKERPLPSWYGTRDIAGLGGVGEQGNSTP